MSMYGGDAQPPRCDACGFVLDHAWVDPSFAAAHLLDVSFTYDGCLIVSDRFRAAVERFPGVSFVPLPSQTGWSLLLSTRPIAFDSERRRTRFGRYCEGCCRFTEVAGATPVFLVDPPIPLPDEIMRTDIEFGSGDELRPLIVVGPGVAEAIKHEGFTGLDLVPIDD